jgi:carbonic anhydrase
MRLLSNLFTKNRAWAAEMTRQDPEFFARLSRQQAPEYLWIGCSDSRVPANQIVGLLPGEMFVHRNVANVVVHTDLNCLSTIQFAIDVLRVKHIIVCGHYGCGGVLAALRDEKVGLADNWLRHVQDVGLKHATQLDALADESARHDRLCELNVVEQVVNVSQTTVVRDAWTRGQSVAVHGWIYDLQDGLLRDLGMCVTSVAELAECTQEALSGATAYSARGDGDLARERRAPGRRAAPR